MSDIDPNDNPNDVDRALAAFGATPIKYRSFGKHQLRPSAAYVPAPAIIDDTVYDPFGPQPVVHSLDEARIGLVLPANVPQPAGAAPRAALPEFSQSDPIVVEHPAPEEYVSSPSEGYSAQFIEPPPQTAFVSYDAPPQATAHEELGIPDHDGLAHEVAPYHEVPAYGVPESNSDALPEKAHHLPPREVFVEGPPAPTYAVHYVEPVAPPPLVPLAQSWAAQTEPAREFEREPEAELPRPAQPGHRSRLDTRAAPPPSEAPREPLVARAEPAVSAPPPPPAPSYSAPIAPVSAASFVAEAPEPATLPTLGSQLAARQNHRPGDGFGLDLDTEPRSLVEMFRVLNGRPGPGRRIPAPPLADGTSLFRRL